MIHPPRILITPGEPAGIGPDVTIAIAADNWPAELVVVADPDLMQERASQLKLPLRLKIIDLDHPPLPHQPGTLNIIPVSLNQRTIAGQLNNVNADYVIRTLTKAADICISGDASGIVTAPVNKEVINTANIPFPGHTEFFAAHADVPHTVMLFVTPTMKVALATTHLPLNKVATAITKDLLRLTLSTLRQGLKEQFHLSNPRMLVCGLNPHAGEGGYLGREEIEVITPLLNELREEGYHLEGPLPADTIFTPKYLAKADAILSMYHDQGLPVVKSLSFGHSVNVTLGLPYIRTSVDHGTALDLAGTGLAEADSLKAALRLAIQLSTKH